MYQIFCILFSFIFLTLAASEPQDISKDEISDSEARLELARALSYLKRYDESLEQYHKLLQTAPDSFMIRLEMAKVLFYQEKTEEALAEISQVPSEKIDDSTWIIIADIYRKKKNYLEAENIYSHYLKKFPLDDKVRLKLAELLSWEKRYDESIQEYQIILTHRPQDIQVRRRYAQVLTWKGDDEEAIKEWKKTLQ
jgi:tetratricopeptide (TPR) repeat protein